MCGIVGYAGEEKAAPILIEGLRRLEYRGYDSAGIAVNDNDIVIIKEKGKIDNLEKYLSKKYGLKTDEVITLLSAILSK